MITSGSHLDKYYVVQIRAVIGEIADQSQQVNNGHMPHAGDSRAQETEKQPNKLLEHKHGERVDGSTASKAGCIDSAMEAMATVDRTPDGKR